MNLISMSLWGTRDLHTQGAVHNARLAPAIYSGWTLRIYCSPEVPVLGQLRSLGVDVRIMPGASDHSGLFWRFLPAGDAAVEHVIVRDADSRLNVRERAAVDAWIASGQPFHVMRDHRNHRRAPMLGGMWGCRGGAIPDIRHRIARFERGAAKHDDTRFLREEIWPLICDRAVVHSSVPDPLGGDPFPPHAPFEGFVGEVVHPRADDRDVMALLLPSRGRPAAALAAARSAWDTAASRDRLRIRVGVEPDEAADYRAAFGEDASWIHVLESGGNYVRAIRELHRAMPASIYGLCADDFDFETPGWDDRVRRAVAVLPGRLGLVFADDGIQRERLATAPFLTAEWIACVADVLPGGYEHMFCDTEITDIARQAGLLRFLPEVRITHRHHVSGQAAVDATYERASATMAAGRVAFDERREERRRLVRLLLSAARQGRDNGWRPAAVLPSLTQQWLLTTALGEAEAARRAWKDWVREVGPDRADRASTPLFPLAWWRLQRLGASGTAVDALKAAYRSSWVESHARFELAAEATRALETAGMPTLLLKGVALASCYYEKPALRPTRDVTVLVPEAAADEARRLMASLGLGDRRGLRLAVHSQVTAGIVPLSIDGCWSRATAAEIGGAAVRVLSPADQLLQVAVTGVSPSAFPAIHWVADAIAILRTASSRIDWDVLVAEAIAGNIADPMRDALAYLRDAFGVEGLDEVCDRLRAGR